MSVILSFSTFKMTTVFIFKQSHTTTLNSHPILTTPNPDSFLLALLQNITLSVLS